MNAEVTTKAWNTGCDPSAAALPAASHAAVHPDPSAVQDPVFAELARLAAAVCRADLAVVAIDELPLVCSDAAPPLELWRLLDARLKAGDGFVEITDVTAIAGADAWPARTAATPIGAAIACAIPAGGTATRGRIGVFKAVVGPLSTAERDGLRLVASQIASQLQLRASLSELRWAALDADAATARSVLDSAPVALYHTDESSKMTYVNPEYRRIFGLAPGQLETDWARVVHENDRARTEKVWNDFCADPRPMHFEYRVRRDGEVRYFREQLVLATGVPGFVGTISDFTDLVTARGDLLKAQTLLETLITDLPVALVACDADGRTTHYNKAALDLHCIQALDNGARVYRADGLTAVAESDLPLARALRGETISSLELIIAPATSARRVTLQSARRLAGEDGRLLGAVAVIEDITERKEAELNLERVHRELMTASRQAGMAEVATNVLHNVGNILNSVNISSSLVAERVKQSKAPGLTRIAALLAEQGERLAQFITTDPRGRRLPEYLGALAAQLAQDQQVTLEELASLRENLEHIKDTVAMQQSYAKLCGVTETVEVAELVEDSLRLNAGAFARHGVTLLRDYQPVAAITVDKHKVLQILVNLVRNAKYACDESGRQDKVVTLRIEAITDGVRISVIDNGVGILPQNMSRLFNHGFTTRKSGHGFGLHSGALAAQDLGGTLRAASDGPGRGATFSLELPRCVAPPARG